MIRILFFLIGFGFAIIGFMYIIMYLNYLEIGYSYLEYLQLIFTKFECLLAVIGILIISLVVFLKGGKNDLYL